MPGRGLVNRYTVLDLLGEGGMGRVYSAYDARLDRRVALKLVHSREVHPGRDGLAGVRMVREAQSMARLNHPHVVAVYDAGTLEDGSVFIAMEYIQGQTLRQWCQHTPSRPWRAVVQAYLAAGRGLAAAHAAGLVHRDFKPDNVLVGEDGRVRVTDFGLARAGAAPGPEAPPVTAIPLSALATSLTLPGSVLGTPAYMAPELLQGQPANLRSDVYAFCASLHEALYGRVPFALDSLSSLLDPAQERKRPSPPPDSQVPTWVFRALVQGLHPEPSQRPDSLEQVLRRLEEDPQAWRRAGLRMGALAATVALLAGGAVALWARFQGPGCDNLAHRLDGVWDAQVRGRVTQALQGTGLTYAEDTAKRVERLLDGYAQAWVKQRVEVCEAAGGPEAALRQPRSLALLREACLDRRRNQLHALTQLLGRGPDPELGAQAVQVAQALPPLEYCADAQALLAAVPPPEDPQTRARVEALQARVDPLAVLHSAGKYQEGLALSEQLLPQVEPLGYAPLQARTLLLRARLQEGAGDYKASEATARQAISVAARGADAVLAAQAWSLVLLLVGPREARLQDAVLLEPLVETVVELSHDDDTRAEFLKTRGMLLDTAGKYAEAKENYDRALAVQEKLFGANHLKVADTLTEVGNVLRHMGRYTEAKARIERALTIQQEVVGPTHLNVARALALLGNVYQEMGEYQEAQRRDEQALGMMEQILGPEHLQTGILLQYLGNVLLDLGEYAEARRRHERSLTLLKKALGPEHPYVSMSLASLGLALAGLGRNEEARVILERALTRQEKGFGPEHPYTAMLFANLGKVLADLGRDEAARALQERAVAALKKALGPTHPIAFNAVSLLGRTLTKLGRYEEAQRQLEHALVLQEESQTQIGRAEPLTGLGLLHLARGRPADAVPVLEQALGGPTAQADPEIRFALARALWDSKQDRPRALELATHARERWRLQGHTPHVTEVSQWLDARR
ncbi:MULTISPECIES: serine/threonine-protein kinase [unclassified Corallococcus]|uniref:serine/threonine-protein kinase n=1 Tax=unclassified Corallococcus TaxID=2685029 RepID=UPI001A8E4D10|nr:serine/threonine-protein kinase [Corallococcus sp. NCRR]MBN9687362.1 serine/threonine protein kinase [Corallococcus sp. NCSPR001]WAS88816.1 serine/threonine-protein kinase [Corallococcus sp. NCRR]